jgi:hypothetical protein
VGDYGREAPTSASETAGRCCSRCLVMRDRIIAVGPKFRGRVLSAGSDLLIRPIQAGVAIRTPSSRAAVTVANN